MESLKIGRTTLDEMHMVYENGIIPDDERELNTFLDVPTSYSWPPENTTPYTHYREDEDYKGVDDEDLLEEGLKKIARSKAKVKGLSYEPSTLKPYTLTLNGKFVKEGEVQLYSIYVSRTLV